jgi:hypothetical protein
MNSDGHLNPDPSLEALKAQLRALPQPPVPSGLEARLLRCVPSSEPSFDLRNTPRLSPPLPPLRKGGKSLPPLRKGGNGRWAVGAAVVVAAAAASVLGMLAWSPRPGHNPPAISQERPAAYQEVRTPRFESTSIAALQGDHRLLDEEKLPAFAWPIENTAMIRALAPIPADLLD